MICRHAYNHNSCVLLSDAMIFTDSETIILETILILVFSVPTVRNNPEVSSPGVVCDALGNLYMYATVQRQRWIKTHTR